MVDFFGNWSRYCCEFLGPCLLEIADADSEADRWQNSLLLLLLLLLQPSQMETCSIVTSMKIEKLFWSESTDEEDGEGADDVEDEDSAMLCCLAFGC
jgi:hypothetical protein